MEDSSIGSPCGSSFELEAFMQEEEEPEIIKKMPYTLWVRRYIHDLGHANALIAEYFTSLQEISDQLSFECLTYQVNKYTDFLKIAREHEEADSFAAHIHHEYEITATSLAVVYNEVQRFIHDRHLSEEQHEEISTEFLHAHLESTLMWYKRQRTDEDCIE